MGEHDCETIARAHLVSLRWASGPSSLRAEPPRHRLRRIALRATGRGQAFSRLFVVHRTTFAEGDARGGSERSDSPLGSFLCALQRKDGLDAVFQAFETASDGDGSGGAG